MYHIHYQKSETQSRVEPISMYMSRLTSIEQKSHIESQSAKVTPEEPLLETRILLLPLVISQRDSFLAVHIRPSAR
jgi:hypothetical protein